MRRVSAEELDYFERITRQNRALPEDEVPSSLAEMFDRLERIRERCGSLSSPGVDGGGEGDLHSHLAFLERQARIRRRGAERA